MLKKKDYFFLIAIFFSYSLIVSFQNSIFFTNDSINFLRNAIIIKSNLYNLNIELEGKLFYPIFYSFIISNFFTIPETQVLSECLNKISDCNEFFDNIIIFHSIILFVTAFIIFIISQKIFKNKIISYLSFFLFLFNSFYFSRIYFVTPEIISIFFLTLSFLLIIQFFNKKKFTTFLFLIITLSILFLLKPIFLIINLIFFLYLFYLKKIKILYFLFSITFFLLIFYLSNNYKKTIIGENNFNYELTVIEQRTAYGFVKYTEIIPLFISFIPIIGDNINEKIFDQSKIERVKPNINGRNLFYNSRDEILNKSKNSLQISEIIIKNFTNFDKQLILSPIFLMRGLFMQVGFNDYFSKFSGIFLTIYIYLNYLIYSISKIFLLLICLKSLLSKNRTDLNLFLMYPTLVFVVHSVLTHNLPRYTSILIGIGAIFLTQKIYKIVIDNLKEKNE